jgi:hypothetical protein
MERDMAKLIIDGITWIDDEYDERTGPAEPARAAGGWKRNAIMKYLADHFPDGVPEPAECPRKQLRSDILRAKGWTVLDEATLKSAIEIYNAS